MEFIIFQILILLFSIVIHEVAHGFMAEHLGDPTARMAGRLTLNPLKHIDAFGSVILPLILIVTRSPIVLGWAKPVPYNPHLLTKDLKYGPLKVALAGPGANITIAVLFGILLRFTYMYSVPFTFLVGIIVFLNLLLAVFNLVPIPPLDGSKILTVLLPRKYSLMVQRIGMVGIMFVLLFVFYFGNVIFGLTSVMFQVIAGADAFHVFMTVMNNGI